MPLWRSNQFGGSAYTRIRLRGGAGSYILLPVLTTTQRDALSPAAGWLVYNSTTTQVESYNGSAWVAVGKLYGDATFLPLAGGEMSGNITFAGAQTVDGVDVSAHAADLDAHTRSPWEVIPLNSNFLSPYCPDRPNATFVLVANRVYTQPFPVVRPVTLSGVFLDVQTGAGSSNCRVVIYLDSGAGKPSALLLNCGTVATATAGVKSITGLSTALARGLYWIAIISDGTPTVYGANHTLFTVAYLTGLVRGHYDDAVGGSYASPPDPHPAASTDTGVLACGIQVSALG